MTKRYVTTAWPNPSLIWPHPAPATSSGSPGWCPSCAADRASDRVLGGTSFPAESVTGTCSPGGSCDSLRICASRGTLCEGRSDHTCATFGRDPLIFGLWICLLSTLGIGLQHSGRGAQSLSFLVLSSCWRISCYSAHRCRLGPVGAAAGAFWECFFWIQLVIARRTQTAPVSGNCLWNLLR